MVRGTPESVAERIERICLRKLHLHTSLEGNLHKCHPQNQSALYSVLPKELRDLIFDFATSQTEDLSRSYKPTDYWCRPGNTAPLITYTSLLRTCRRVFLETHDLPLKHVEVPFYFSDGRGPPSTHQKLALCLLNRGGPHPAEMLQRIQKVHFHAQMFVAENMFWGRGSPDIMLKALKPRSLRLTIRHTDWWCWEGDAPLRFQMAWLQRLLDAPHLACLDTFILELETLESKKDQLKPIIDELLTKVSVPRRNRSSDPGTSPLSQLRIESPVRIQHWTGPSDIAEKSYTPYKNVASLAYHISILKWTSHAVPASDNPVPFYNLAPAIGTHSRGRNISFVRCGTGRSSTRFPLGANRVYQQLQAWDSSTQMPFEAFLTQREDVLRATREHDSRSVLWSKTMAEDEVRKLTAEWREKDSLLGFSD